MHDITPSARGPPHLRKDPDGYERGQDNQVHMKATASGTLNEAGVLKTANLSTQALGEML